MANRVTVAELGIDVRDSVLGPPLPLSTQVTGLTADSREVVPGAIFAALGGGRAHGADFLGEAASRGAVAALASPAGAFRALEASGAWQIPILVDPAPRRRLARLASRFWPERPAIRAAVTGTNGKTSTVEFLYRLWRLAGRPAAAIGTLGAVGPEGRSDTALTTPDPVSVHRLMQRFAREGAARLAIEASSHALSQGRLDGLEPTVAALSSFSRDHLDYHGGRDAYAEAKLRLFAELLPASGAAVADADSGLGRCALALASARGSEAIPVGFSDAARDGIRIVSVDCVSEGGQSVAFRYRGASYRANLPLAGDFQAKNALLAAGCAIASGMTAEDVFSSLERLRPVPGRMQLALRLAAGGAAYVDYAHTPDALRVALGAARLHVREGCRLHVVFGAGGERDAGKRAAMGKVAAALADRVVITDDNPRGEDPARIREQLRAGAPGAVAIGDRAEAIRAALAGLRPGDVLLVAGKGHEAVQETAAGVVPFDDVGSIRALASGLGERS